MRGKSWVCSENDQTNAKQCWRQHVSSHIIKESGVQSFIKTKPMLRISVVEKGQLANLLHSHKYVHTQKHICNGKRGINGKRGVNTIYV